MQRQIPDNQTPNQGKDILNENFDNAERRLQALETNVYIHGGNSDPSPLLGNDNDYYVDDLNQNLWQKRNGNWIYLLNMKGETGRGFRPRGEWNGNLINYAVDDVVTFAGAVYRVKFQHTSEASNPPPNSNTELWADGFRFRGEWVANTLYKVNDVVTRLGSTYVTIAEHTGGAQPVNSASFVPFATGYNFAGVWDSAGFYVTNELVTYKGSMYKLAATKAIGDTATPPAAPAVYTLIARGLNFRGNYSGTATYDVGDVVSYENSSYVANVNSLVGGPVPPSTSNFLLLAKGLFHRGAWVTGTAYRIDNTVTHQGSLYRVSANHTSSGTVTPATSVNYQLLASKGDKGDKGDKGLQYRGAWESAITYSPDDVVQYLGNSFIAVTTSTNAIPTDSVAWSLLASRGDPGEGVNVSGLSGAPALTVGITGYTLGTSIYSMDSANGAWPSQDGTLVVDKSDATHATQTVTDISGTKYTRAWNNAISNWSAWKATPGVPVCSITMWPTDAIPTDYLPCDGRLVSTTTYALAFSILGYKYGGSGSLFGLPNMSEKVPVGKGANASGHDLTVVGNIGGSKLHQLAWGEMPSHAHSNGSTGSTNPALNHSHDISISARGFASGSITGITQVHNGTAGESSRTTTENNINGSHSHSIPDTNAAGSGNAHNNMQPYMVVNYIIKVG